MRKQKNIAKNKLYLFSEAEVFMANLMWPQMFVFATENSALEIINKN